MTAKNRGLRLFKLLTVCLLLAPISLLAQNTNLIPSIISDFTIHYVGNEHTSNYLQFAGVDTDYAYVSWNNGLLGDDNVEKYAIGTNARFYSHNSIVGIETGMFDMGDHTTGNGNYMIVNGTTSEHPENKRVWEYTVAVTPGIQYQFQAYVTSLYMYPYGNAPDYQKPKLQLKINDLNVGSVFTVPWNNNSGQWVQWTRNWTAGNNVTSAKITIVDNCRESNGNDFGLDDIVFKLDDAYSLTANDFTVQYCGEITPIDLTGHYAMTYPGNVAPPMQVKVKQSIGAPSWGTACDTYYGNFHVTVGSDNKIYLTLNNPNFHGTDYVRYQVSGFGMTTDKKITISYYEAPSNCAPQGLPSDGFLCYNSVSSFNPSANWSSNGSAITNPGWQWKKDGVTGWQNSNAFLNYVQGLGGVGEYSIKFLATNECGQVESDAYPVTICDVPEITQSDVTNICTGSAEPMVSVNMNYNSGAQTWQYKRGNGNWTDFVWGQFDLLPGDQIRYQVTWDHCGGSPWTSSTIYVDSGPEFNSSIPVSFEDGYCPGATVTLPPIQSNWYTANVSVTTGWYKVIDNPSGSPDYQLISGNSVTLDNESLSVTPGLLNTECGELPTTYFPAFDLVVWEAPAILGLENLPDSLGPVCLGTTLSDILPELSPDGHYHDNGYGWEISAGENPSDYQSNLPQTLAVNDNGRWLRYRVEGCQQYGDATSNPIRVWVGDKPELNMAQIEPIGTVCAGTMVTSVVEDVQVISWNLFDDPDESYARWEVYMNGAWTEFTQFELIHDGCPVRHHAHNQCGDAFLEAGEVNVTLGPSFNNPDAPLSFAEYYCDGTTLDLPTPPLYDGHGINVSDFYWAYFDGNEYHRINSTPQLDESWNGRQITYVLESACGGGIYYPTHYTLTVKGRPEVDISLTGSSSFCVDIPIALDTLINWHLCSQNVHASSWQYAPVSQPNDYTDFNPSFGIPEAGEYLINYHAVANECGFEAYCDYPIQVTINAAPEFENPGQPFELDRFCEEDLLELPSAPSVTGYVENASWKISVGTEPDGTYEPIEPNYHLTLDDNGRWLQYYAIGCNTPIHYEMEIHVDGKPQEEYAVEDRICKGQRLSYRLVNSNDYPVTDREWRLGSPSGESFDPDEYVFDVEGNYWIYYRVGNECGWQEDYAGPLPLTVTAGPEFDNSFLPNGPQYVCEGTTVGALLQQLGITTPPLLDPSVPHEALGWFINGQPIELDDVIVEGFHGTGLCYAVSGNCSEVPVYSRGVLLHVYGYPEVTQMPPIDWEFCDGDEAQLPDPDIDPHHGDGFVNGYWQIQSHDGLWSDLPDKWSAEHHGLHVRYHLENTVCPNLASESQPLTIIIDSAPSIGEDGFPASGIVTLCSGGSLDISNPNVDWHQSSSGDEGWQVSADGLDWGTQLEGHAFDPNHVDDFFDGKYLRYHAALTQCPDLEDKTEVLTIQLMDSPGIDDGDWPDQARFCSEGSLDIDEPEGLPGEWQVSGNGTNWSTELEGHVFDPDRVEDYFDGKLLRYFVHSSCGDDESKALTMKLMGAVNMPIVGETQVAMMNSIWTGIYDYHVDSADLVHPVEWWLEGANWRLRPMGRARCLVYVSSTGTAVLHARVMNILCSSEVALPINATHFDVEEKDAMEVNIYPNPTRNTVTIEAEGIESIRLTNMMGQLLDWREYERSNVVILNLDGFAPSVYLFEIKTVNGVVKKRVMVCR